ncbi:hypothetical protein QBC32DRAFT_46065 [Pseudoneurospora amorphoporcata]|uniref:Uncharacterized protein n=1 Tax=Pseudoneurospora amorphoporcata TaxID=241081 RepID=A0AAN6SCU9_9PEZI|nr:hypothetical protein QBC32DRAFT_46065 [Pseudoneurospora amorphoporcata]
MYSHLRPAARRLSTRSVSQLRRAINNTAYQNRTQISTSIGNKVPLPVPSRTRTISSGRTLLQQQQEQQKMDTTSNATTTKADPAPLAPSAPATSPNAMGSSTSSTSPRPGSTSSTSISTSASTEATSTTTPSVPEAAEPPRPTMFAPEPAPSEPLQDPLSVESQRLAAGGAPLPLPSPETATPISPSDQQQGPKIVTVNGQAVALDNLGPMVVHKDGTISRIANWHEMTDLERETTLRVLGKRNQLRLTNLREGRVNGEGM